MNNTGPYQVSDQLARPDQPMSIPSPDHWRVEVSGKTTGPRQIKIVRPDGVSLEAVVRWNAQAGMSVIELHHRDGWDGEDWNRFMEISSAVGHNLRVAQLPHQSQG